MKELSKKLASFEGLYISGTFIDNGALVTALALLFEKVYLRSFYSGLLDVARNLRLIPTDFERDLSKKSGLTDRDRELDDMLSPFTEEQRLAAKVYSGEPVYSL